MLHLVVHRVRADRVHQLEVWLREARRRCDEVRATMRDEGVTHEQAHLVHTADGTLLIRVVEARDYATASRIFEKSKHPIDADHKAVLAEVLDGEVGTLLALDIRR